MRFPHIRNAPVAEAKRQRSVFSFTRFLIASWIYYTLLHPYTVIQYMIIDPEPDLTVYRNGEYTSIRKYAYTLNIPVTTFSKQLSTRTSYS
jgi:hypothetical protein